MSKLSGLFAGFLFACTLNAQDSIMFILNQVFPAYELNVDLAFIKNKAENKRYYGNGLLYAGKDRFYQLYDSIEKVIDSRKEMSRLDFYLLTAPLVQCIQDDQSYYSLTGEYVFDKETRKYFQFPDKIAIPFGIEVFNDTAFIIYDNTKLNHSQILNINKIPAVQVMSEIFKYTSFSRFQYYDKHQYGILNLFSNSILTNVLFGFSDEVVIEYIPSGSDSVVTQNIKLLFFGDSTYSAYWLDLATSQSWYDLRFDRNYAILRIKSLPEVEMNIHFLNDIFRRINAKKPEGLIIDISDCRWSHDNYWIVLLNYLCDGKIWLYGYHKKSFDLKTYTKKRIAKSEYIIGKYADIDQTYKFQGRVYLITGSNTASAAVRFADILRFNKIVTHVYGEETLTRPTHFDLAITHYLPVTKLQIKLSAVLNYALDKNVNNIGFLPDTEVKPDNTKEFLENTKNKIVIQKVMNHIISGE